VTTSNRKQTATVERAAYTIAEFCEAYRVHRATVWRMIKAGELRSFTIGRRVLIPVEAAEALKAA
jgi:excisionase family DNA binding protein